jgi:hypothetical protein
MRNLGRISIAGMVPLRAVVALVFLLLSSLQPGLFATANATGFHADNGMKQLSASVASDGDQAGRHDHAGRHTHYVADKGEHGAPAKHHHGEGKSSDTSCKVHCAGTQAVPVGCPSLMQPSSGCVALAVFAAFRPAEPAEFVKPPRPLN